VIPTTPVATTVTGPTVYGHSLLMPSTERALLLLLLLSDSGGLDTGTGTGRSTDTDPSRSLQQFEY